MQFMSSVSRDGNGAGIPRPRRGPAPKRGKFPAPVGEQGGGGEENPPRSGGGGGGGGGGIFPRPRPAPLPSLDKPPPHIHTTSTPKEQPDSNRS